MSEHKIKRLFFDLEVSPNVALCWSAGYKISIPYENIIKERAIICACWKWEGEKRVYSLEWDNGDDKKLLKEFCKIVDSADEAIGHNSDNFDLKWLRTRCLYHGIPMSPNIRGVDTYKLAKASFRFNSNRLDYIGSFLGLGGKKDTGGYGKLWRAVTLENSKQGLKEMVAYCKRDVQLTEDVYHKLESYGAYRTHAGVLAGGQKRDCVRCASANTQKRGQRVSATGSVKQIMSCNDCGRHYTVSLTEANRSVK
jgi:predicted PolB exonuclease-like 3'-5' exonuclease